MPIAVIGPGTGLGVSGLIPTGEHWIPLQGEGGHVTLSVMNEREMAVFAQLHQRFSHVSAERVLSGPGLVNLYDALCALEGVVPEVLAPPDVTRRAKEASCRICLEAVSMFCALLGTMAGNLVLTLGAVGGVYIGGGIVPSLGAPVHELALSRSLRRQGSLRRLSRCRADVRHPFRTAGVHRPRACVR